MDLHNDMPSLRLLQHWMSSYARRHAIVALLTAAHCLASTVVFGALAEPAADRIREVEEGRLTEANAAWWGFDPEDATDSLQRAIHSKAKRIRIPMAPGPWIVRPIQLRSGLELILEPGALVLAKSGEFRGGGDSLFRAVDATNIVIRGYGATLRMRKADYQRPPYPKAEWRMGLNFSGCRDVRVEGLRIESSGGDGIYIGSSQTNRWCENVVIRDCTAIDHHRQGISIISAVNLAIENCSFSGTAGTAPEAGIDFEPDEPDERLVNCVVRNCSFTDNQGNAALVYLKPLTGKSVPVSIRFEDCHARMGPSGATPDQLLAVDRGGWSGFAVGAVRDHGPAGTIDFVRCTSENTGRECVRIFDKSPDGVRVRFVDCTWKNAWIARHRDYAGPRAPILFQSRDAKLASALGGVDFVNCRLFTDLPSPAVRLDADTDGVVAQSITGTISMPEVDKHPVHWTLAKPGVTLRLEPLSPTP